MSLNIPAYDEDCRRLAKQLVTKHPQLKNGFDEIDAFVKELEGNPSLEHEGNNVRVLTTKVVDRYFGTKDEATRCVYGEYLSYTRAADSIFTAYSLFLRDRGLEGLTEKKAGEFLTETCTFSDLRVLLWNYTDASSLFSERVCSSGILRYFVMDLKAILSDSGLPRNVSLKDPFFRSARGILHNCSQNPITRQPIRELGTVSVALAYIKHSSSGIKVLMLLLLANIIDEENNRAMLADKTVFTTLLTMVKTALEQRDHRSEGFSVSELIVGLTGLAKNDDNKKFLTEKGAISVLMAVMQKGSDEEREKAAKCVWELAFNKENRKIFLLDAQLMGVLRNLKQSANKHISRIAKGALWATTQTEKKPPLPRPDLKEEEPRITGHLMISYQWADQKTLVKVKESLRQRGYNIWMDIDDMEGSTLQAMAEAVQNASVVLVCMSERYKLSQNCRSEAEYAFNLRKPIVPLMMQRDYKPDGWLGFIKGTKLYFEFSGKYPYDQKITDLVKELGKRGQVPLDTCESSSLEKVQSVGLCSASVHSNVASWSDADVQKWLCEIGLESQCMLKNLTGQQILFLRKVLHKAPEFFYSYIKIDLRLSSLEDIMIFSEAVETL
ncbi:uncharacterized protein LOC124131334 [Haliotis rufescens]|uniref:uncharacterized protein LOC124131334 n=1 Tax=Haliotis rufescens TaxID=6454 RepID=UPI00201F8E02|nr:uncharacterized protein LOC124131334 [Haliotis rufescens]